MNFSSVRTTGGAINTVVLAGVFILSVWDTAAVAPQLGPAAKRNGVKKETVATPVQR